LTLPPQPAVSVIIVNYNGLAFLQTCLSALARTTYKPMDTLMVDNASSDGSVAFVAEHYPTVRIIPSSTNLGYSGGNNLGIKEAPGDIVVLLNNDTEVTPGWLEPLVAEFGTDDGIAACQPKVLSATRPTAFEYAGAAGGFMDQLGYPYLRGRVFDTIEEDRGQYQEAVDLFWASGAAFAVRKDVLAETGLLDEDFRLHMEEIDLCWRLHLRGYRVRVCPEAVIYHYGGGTLGRGQSRKHYYNHRNGVFMLLKNYSALRLLWVAPARALLDLVLVVKSLLTLDFARAAAVVAAYAWLLRHPLLIWRKRQPVQRLRQLSDRELTPLLHPVSIVWAYYLRGKKTYAAITGKGG